MLKDTAFLKDAAASPDAHSITGSVETVTQTEFVPCHRCPAGHREVTKM